MPKITLFSLKNRPALGALPPDPHISLFSLSRYEFLVARLILPPLSRDIEKKIVIVIK